MLAYDVRYTGLSTLGVRVYVSSPATAKYCFEEKPTPATSLPGLSIACWLFDPGEVSSQGCRAHLTGSSKRQKPQDGREMKLFPTTPHALYGTRLCGPVIGGKVDLIYTYRKTLHTDSRPWY